MTSSFSEEWVWWRCLGATHVSKGVFFGNGVPFNYGVFPWMHPTVYGVS